MTPRQGAHEVRRAVPRLDPPPEVRQIAATLERAGHETWCVGGAVRDALLGLPHLDWDLATAAKPPEVKKLFRRTVAVGERFGTVGVLDARGRLHEVTTFRRDVNTDGRHAVVEFGASLEEDLARRDFTINAMAFSPSRDAFADPFGGQDDLARGVVRAVGDPRARMVEDRLRALRAIRFAGRFEFEIDGATWAALRESVPHLNRLSRERVKQELEKTMEQLRCPSRAMTLWRSSGAIGALLPQLAQQPEWTLSAADVLARPDDSRDAGRKRRRTLVRLATLFVGLPADGARRALRDLRFSNRDVEWEAALARAATALRDELRHLVRQDAEPSDAVMRRWAAATGRTRLADTLRVAFASLAAEEGGIVQWRPRMASLYRRALRVAYRDPVEPADLAVDGDDLMMEGVVSSGPAVGALLRSLLDLVITDPSLNARSTLLARARDLALAPAGATRGDASDADTSDEGTSDRGVRRRAASRGEETR